MVRRRHLVRISKRHLSRADVGLFAELQHLLLQYYWFSKV